MGTGKTFFAEQYLTRNISSSVLASTFRISLAKYMSSRLDLNCYLEENIFQQENSRKWDRFVVCLESLWKLPEKILWYCSSWWRYIHSVPFFFRSAVFNYLVNPAFAIMKIIWLGSMKAKLPHVIAAFKEVLENERKEDCCDAAQDPWLNDRLIFKYNWSWSWGFNQGDQAKVQQADRTSPVALLQR